MTSENRYYTAYDIADIFGICYAKALDWIKYSGVPYVRIGRTYHVRISTFNSFTANEANNE